MTLFYAITALGSLALIFGVLLGYAAVKYRVESSPVVDQVDAIYLIRHSIMFLIRDY